jgi:eukaryotic-like serine/threonine-protein kinase
MTTGHSVPTGDAAMSSDQLKPGLASVAAGEQTPDATADHNPDAPPCTVPDPGPAQVQNEVPEQFVTEGQITRIGPYKLLRKIGEGGMGAVFLAEQEQPVRRRVALKIIKPGMDTEQVIARFQAERQALALMDHPNIARVLDAGATESGRPYFVMELVNGVPITEYCDGNRLTIRARLDLFVLVCQAIQHAHQKGIIHRDVKPSNILVTVSDGKPLPKVIDFGVAKAVDQGLAAGTMLTRFGTIVGTLDYMSPEQAGMGGVDVDTRSDIYSLGVVLYEILTATTPLHRARMPAIPYTEILRSIREQEPPRPSTRLSESRDGLPAISANRQIEPVQLRRLVRGELDWIVMKAIEKDRSRRYETANALARDIQRHLAGDPVEAGPPSTTYRLRKLARKHAVALTTAGAFATLLLAAAAISSFLALAASRAEATARTEAARAKRSEEESKAVLQFFQKKVLSAARPKGHQGALGKDATIRAAVDAAEPGIETSFAGQPAVEASIRDTLGESYSYFGEPDLAIRQLERALALRRQVLGLDHPETLATMNALALAHEDAGNPSDAVSLLEEKLNRTKSKLGPDDPETLRSMTNLAEAYQEAHRLKEATVLLEETRRRRLEKLGPDHPDSLTSMHNLALVYRDDGRTAEAVSLLEEALKGRRATLGPDDVDTLATMNSLANTYRNEGRLTDALPLYEEACARYKSTLGLENSLTLAAMNNLATAYQASGRIEEALSLFKDALKGYTDTFGAEHVSTVILTDNLANAYRDAGRLADALPMLERSLAQVKAKLGPDHPHTLMSTYYLARAYLDAKPAQAEPLLREFLAIRQRKTPDDWRTFETKSLLGESLLKQKKCAEAEPFLIQGYEGMKARERKIPKMYRKRLAEAGARIVRLYDVWGKPRKSAEWRNKLADNTKASKSSP